MQRNQNNGMNPIEEKQIKTVVLFTVANILTSSLFLINHELGFAALLILNAAMVNHVHELGKSRRPGANMLNTAHSWFSSQVHIPSNDIDNALRNIINGGAAMFDELAYRIEDYQRRNYR